MRRALLTIIFLLVLVARGASFALLGNDLRFKKSLLGASSLEVPTVEAVGGDSNRGGGNEEVAQVMLVTPREALSPFREKPFGTAVAWKSVFEHVKERTTWESQNGRFDASQGDIRLHVVTCEELLEQDVDTFMGKQHQKSPILVLAGMKSVEQCDLARKIAKTSFEAISVVDCSDEVSALEKYGEYEAAASDSSLLNSIDDKIGSLFRTKKYSNKSAGELVQSLWRRESVEDTLFAMLILINEFTDYFVQSVQEATSTSTTGLKELKCMCSKCGEEMIDCFGNPECRKALDCLNSCKANDQVCSYKCITSYETKAFESFAQCILQRHNCMGNHASVPVVPNPAPLVNFRGRPLDHEVAEEIFVGHLAPRAGEQNVLLEPGAPLEEWSWKVVCGVNPAYDYFSDQHQIFYRDCDGRGFWYDPTFKVVTLDNEEVWRRRHYRVRRRRDTGPGTFQFTVLDNGVLSNEFWRILDVADDLSWAVFYYSGAASAAGTSYSGGLVCTRDGQWPSMPQGTQDPTYQRIASALRSGGITMYELFEVKQSQVNQTPPPLGYN